MLLVTLGANRKRNVKNGYGSNDFQYKEGKGIIRGGYCNKNFFWFSTPSFNKHWITDISSEWI